jgi:hypothetical protein
VAFPSFENGRYLQTLNQEIAKVQPSAMRVGAIDQQVEDAQKKMALLEDLRASSKRDMDVLAELTLRLAPPTWLNALDIGPEIITVAGETPEAPPLLKLLDESPLFEGSEFIGAPSRRDSGESFRIRMRRSANATPAPAEGGKQ